MSIEQKQDEFYKLPAIDQMIHCIEQAFICVPRNPDTEWLREILLKNAHEIKEATP